MIFMAAKNKSETAKKPAKPAKTPSQSRSSDIYDFIIIGGGPGGLSAAIYASRFKLKTVVLVKAPGGSVMLTHMIENYPGAGRISSAEFVKQWIAHVELMGVPMVDTTVTGVSKKDNLFAVETEGKTYLGRSILIATGTEHRKLGVPGEEEFANKGVSYCAVCDGPLFKDKIIGVVGGSDSAAKESIFLARHAKKVYIIYRKEKLRAEPATVEEVAADKKIEIIPNTVVTEIKGGKVGFLESVVLEDVNTKKRREFPLEGLFIEIGGIPGSDIARELGVKLNEEKEIIVDSGARTNMPGIFAAGDVTNSEYKQIITAAAQGAAAAYSAYQLLRGKKQ